MLEVKAESIGLLQTLDIQLIALAGFPPVMTEELRTWETEDVHRHQARGKQEGNTATTTFWQHSRKFWSTYWRRKWRAEGIQRTPRRRPRGKKASRIALRPVLRPILLDDLNQRMVALMHEQFKWQ